MFAQRLRLRPELLELSECRSWSLETRVPNWTNLLDEPFDKLEKWSTEKPYG